MDADYLLLLDADMVLQYPTIPTTAGITTGITTSIPTSSNTGGVSTSMTASTGNISSIASNDINSENHNKKTSSLVALKRRLFDHDAWSLYQGGPGFYNKNTRLIRNRPGNSYWGVTHEYIQIVDGSSMGTFTPDELFINDIGDGGSKSNKFDRDIQLLTQGLVDLPNNDRYTFYLANSYRDKGDTLVHRHSFIPY